MFKMIPELFFCFTGRATLGVIGPGAAESGRQGSDHPRRTTHHSRASNHSQYSMCFQAPVNWRPSEYSYDPPCLCLCPRTQTINATAKTMRTGPTRPALRTLFAFASSGLWDDLHFHTQEGATAPSTLKKKWCPAFLKSFHEQSWTLLIK